MFEGESLYFRRKKVYAYVLYFKTWDGMNFCSSICVWAVHKLGSFLQFYYFYLLSLYSPVILQVTLACMEYSSP